MSSLVSPPPPVRLRALAHRDLADLVAVQQACYGAGHGCLMRSGLRGA
ncbi:MULTISPECIES: hypothetical protein [Acidovorax]|nr:MULTISPECIES: hypothetical protein [Acidovorax]